MDNYFEYIFSKETCQQILLLEQLYNNPLGLDIDELGDKIDLERRTLRRHLSYINDVANEYVVMSKPIIFQKKKYVFTGSKSEYYALKCNILKPESLLNLFELFLNSQSVNFIDFCKENFMSESTARRKLKKANVLLQSIGMKLTIRKDEIYIIGEERIIRYSLISLFWRVYRGTEWPFANVDEGRVENIVSSIISSGRYISYGKRKHLAFYLATFISRSQSGNVISKALLPEYSSALIANNHYMGELSQLIEQSFKLPQVELEFILPIFYIFPECYEEFHSVDDTLAILKKYSRRSYSSIMNFVAFIKKRHPKWDKDSPSTPFFWPMLISGRLFVDIFKDAYFNSSGVRIFKHAGTDYPRFLPTIRKSILSHEPKLATNTLKSLTLRYGQAYIMEFSPHDFEPKIKILLLTDSAMYIEKIISQRVENLLKYRFNFILEIDRPSSTPDLILETDVIDTKYSDSKRLFINLEVAPKDRENILTACKDILKEKY
ncbi:helix-turn-helix domain-containing protein [Lactococcus petauri]|uniref:Mga helix-turn-helix domain-containing protein n=1 Tax=Lactococcus petauri TaxID=1940789 RepID=A0A252CA66_9LACT|nr:helix-turn-helix domain-containing protein [Lactococcus petauri]OUK02182.1 hypothetical protein BZZ03_11525 [Lactococcus petauri]